MSKILTFIMIICFICTSAQKRRNSQTSVSYKFDCPDGTVLKGRKDWTDQQPEGTAFAGFTCCPEGYEELYYINENYFCCPTGSEGFCNTNSCNCKSGTLKGGVIPDIKKLP